MATVSTPRPPPFAFTYSPSVAAFQVPASTYVACIPNAPFTHLATGTIVFETSNPSQPRVLLVQRASTDSSPNKWEVPGGACDTSDPTILHGAARELWEETGLVVSHVKGRVGPLSYFTTRAGMRICKILFVVDVELKNYGGEDGSGVRLDPKEHQDFVWASEQEVKIGKVEERGLVMEFTKEELAGVLIDAFQKLRVGEQVEPS